MRPSRNTHLLFALENSPALLGWVTIGGNVRSDSKERSITTLRKGLLQFRVLRVGLLQDGDVGVGVGVFPEREEIFVGSQRPDSGCIGIRALRGSRLKCGRRRSHHKLWLYRVQPKVDSPARDYQDHHPEVLLPALTFVRRPLACHWEALIPANRKARVSISPTLLLMRVT